VIKDDLEVRLDLDDDVTDDKQMEVTTDIIFFRFYSLKSYQ
jgi:hypothetical protein